MRTAEAWFSSYGRDHQNATNRTIHWVCVPLILWAAIAALWTVPVPSAVGVPGAWCLLAMAAALVFYGRMSKVIGVGMLAVFVVFGAATQVLFAGLGPTRLLGVAAAVFVVAWVGQFIGHKFEGKRPSFLTDLSYLLVGPAWLLGKALRRAGLAW